jgi:hypothetical protein
MLGPNDGAHIDIFIAVGRADAEFAHVFNEPFDDWVARFSDGHGDAAGHAALAGTAIGTCGERFDGLIHVGVGHDDEVVFRTAGRLDALAGRRAALVYVFGDRRGTDERNGGDCRVIQ